MNETSIYACDLSPRIIKKALRVLIIFVKQIAFRILYLKIEYK